MIKNDAFCQFVWFVVGSRVTARRKEEVRTLLVPIFKSIYLKIKLISIRLLL